MANSIILTGAALLMAAAPTFSQSPRIDPVITIDPVLKAGAPEPVWFHLTEDRELVGKLLGKPVLVTESAKGVYSWQYQIDSSDEDYSHYAVFRKSDGKLISVTRQYQPERNVDAFFPEAETVVCQYQPTFGARVRRLSGGRLLIAMGSTKPGQKTGQLLLIRETEVANFYPWIATQLASVSEAKQ